MKYLKTYQIFENKYNNEFFQMMDDLCFELNEQGFSIEFQIDSDDIYSYNNFTHIEISRLIGNYKYGNHISITKIPEGHGFMDRKYRFNYIDCRDYIENIINYLGDKFDGLFIRNRESLEFQEYNPSKTNNNLFEMMIKLKEI